jgi:hypothetical protein
MVKCNMPGNEISVIEYVLSRKMHLHLDHIGLVKNLYNPGPDGQRLEILDSIDVIADSSQKKADIYINQHGVSIKQIGGSFAFNRILRSNFDQLLSQLKIQGRLKVIARSDELIRQMHEGLLDSRNRPWDELFLQEDFYLVLRHLMLIGSPARISQHPATLILTAPPKIRADSEINVYTFDEYFEKEKGNLRISIRRQWVGQTSQSEHRRALSIASDPRNAPWVFDTISGKPRSWRQDFPKDQRKTVYFLMIEKV